jgi:hypothetical protein
MAREMGSGEEASLLASLRDLEAERAAGDLSEDDYIALRDEYTARTAKLLRSQAALDLDAPAPESPSGTSSRARPAKRRWLVWVALGAFAAAAVLLVAARSGVRLPGETGSGTPTLSTGQLVRQQLAQAAVLEDDGQDTTALSLYQEVLQEVPDQPTALAEAGWLEYQAGVSSKNAPVIAQGRADVATALALDSQDFASHLYMGTILWQQDANASGAVAQFQSFLAEDPPAAVIQEARTVITAAYQADGKPLPAALG